MCRIQHAPSDAILTAMLFTTTQPDKFGASQTKQILAKLLHSKCYNLPQIQSRKKYFSTQNDFARHTSLRRPSCGSKCEWATASTMTQGDPNRDLTYFASNSTGHVVAASKTHHRSLVSKVIPSDSGSESG